MHSFSHLLPETILEAVEEQGFMPTGVLYPLNSYENRVYEVHLEEHDPIIAKFYRPGRWSFKAIAEEHAFLDALAEAEVPVVPSLPLKHHLPFSRHLDKTGDIFYAFFPKFRGREHDEILDDDRRWLGRTLARVHNVGESFKAPHRLHLSPQTYGYESLHFILSQKFLPDDLKKNIEIHLNKALALLAPFFDESFGRYFKTPFAEGEKAGGRQFLVHGDCHPGNILWNRDGPFLVDFDDMVIAPPVQDIWMLFSGTEEEKKKQRDIFFEGYEMFRKFDRSTLVLEEPLRTLRMIRHAAWIGQRYQEPAFKRAFPYYEERRYWEEFLLHIKEQISVLQEIK